MFILLLFRLGLLMGRLMLRCRLPGCPALSGLLTLRRGLALRRSLTLSRSLPLRGSLALRLRLSLLLRRCLVLLSLHRRRPRFRMRLGLRRLVPVHLIPVRLVLRRHIVGGRVAIHLVAGSGLGVVLAALSRSCLPHHRLIAHWGRCNGPYVPISL